MKFLIQKQTGRRGRKICAWALLSLGGLLISHGSAHAFDGPGGAKGFGPVTSVSVGDLSEDMAKKGKAIFSTKCSACHKIDERYVGPQVKGVSKKRSPEWVMNMILNPVEMTQKDAAALELLGEFLTQMTFQDVSEDDARHIYEYFRFVDEKGDIPSEGSKQGKGSKEAKPKK